MTSSVEILIPGLLPPEWRPGGLDEPSVKALARALGKASITGAVAASQDFRDQLRGFESRLGQCFGLAEPCPAAPYCYLADSGKREGRPVMAVTPVHLRPEQDRLVLFEGEPLALAEAEAAALVGRVNDHFADRGLKLVAPAPNRWYLIDPPHAAITLTPLHEVNGGRNINPALPRGEDARFWAAILNESQMLLHRDPINQAREAQGRWVINGLWPDGLGVIQTARTSARVYSDHPLTRGLALAAGIEPQSPTQWRCQETAGDDLWVMDQLIEPALVGDIEAWRGRLAQLAKRLAPLLRWAETGGRLMIDPCNGQRFQYQRFCMLRFWRRPRLFP